MTPKRKQDPAPMPRSEQTQASGSGNACQDAKDGPTDSAEEEIPAPAIEKTGWVPVAICGRCGSRDIQPVEDADPATGYRETVWVCSRGHRVDEDWWCSAKTP